MIFNVGGAAFKPPVLNPNYPANVSVVQAANASATFSIQISEAGEPAEYTYQWYVNNTAVSGATGTSYTRTGLTTTGTYVVYCKVTHPAGVVTSRSATLTVLSYLPSYTYSGSHELINDGNYNWRIKLKSTAYINFSNFGTGGGQIEIFSVGGGGGGSLSGGGGGRTVTVKNIQLALNTNYLVTVGAGGSVGAQGGTSSFANLASAAGGMGGYQNGTLGGSGGSGGGQYGGSGAAGMGGTDGGNSTPSWYDRKNSDGSYTWTTNGSSIASGQGYTTREFQESNGTLYAGGGGGGSQKDNYKNQDGYTGVQSGYGGSGGGGNGACRKVNGSFTAAATAGGTNTGGGGGGGNTSGGGGYASMPGGSGIVIIRNKR